MKILRILILASTVIFAITLWMTGSRTLESQSAFALEPNNHWYWLMHLSIFFTFVLDSISNRRLWSFLVALSTLGIVAFDMYSYPMLHNIMTGTMVILAAGNLIYYAGKKERGIAISNAIIALLLFIIGSFSIINLFMSELIVEFNFGLIMTLRILREK